MTIVIQLIQRLFPNKIITHHISDLINQLPGEIAKTENIFVSIENDNKSRQFCYFTLSELITLYRHCPAIERTLYEIIFPTNLIKTYIDFEYYINNNRDIQSQSVGLACCLKIFYYVFNSFDNTNFHNENYIDIALQQLLVLEASTSQKISYHLIHSNPTVLFENNVTLGFFIKTFIHYLLSSVIKHKCAFFDIKINLQKPTIADLITVLSPYITILRIHCTKCYLYTSYINVAEIAHLLILNKQNQWTLAIDLHVYSKNQQFRLFDCVKRGKNNFLIQSTSYPFYNYSKISYFEILQKSIVTYNIEFSALPIIYLNNDRFKLKLNNSNNSSSSSEYDVKILNNINDHLYYYSPHKTSSLSISKSNDLNLLGSNKPDHINISQDEIQKFTPFVQKLITSDINHQGYIYSCVRGKHNNQILFFNIGGSYRFCPRKGAHHQHNTIAILVDTQKLTYSVRCKDSDCNNKFLIWNTL